MIWLTKLLSISFYFVVPIGQHVKFSFSTFCCVTDPAIVVLSVCICMVDYQLNHAESCWTMFNATTNWTWIPQVLRAEHRNLKICWRCVSLITYLHYCSCLLHLAHVHQLACRAPFESRRSLPKNWGKAITLKRQQRFSPRKGLSKSQLDAICFHVSSSKLGQRASRTALRVSWLVFGLPRLLCLKFFTWSAHGWRQCSIW